jgi:hypothetical protein
MGLEFTKKTPIIMSTCKAKMKNCEREELSKPAPERRTKGPYIITISELTFCLMTFLQQVGNKWPSVSKTLQNHIGKATVQQKKRKIE